ncbi:MAG: transcriptional regulator, partial [Pseudomonadota bacterium]|nr:transcriptional regulator [Pseudomonadota bacterium]
LNRRETLELVRADYRINEPAVRKRVFDLIKSMGPTES